MLSKRLFIDYLTVLISFCQVNKFIVILTLFLGHTHSGQLYVLYPVAYIGNKFLHGLYKDSSSSTQVFVSAGVNYWGPPVKMWSFCEIPLIRLRVDSA